MMIQPSCEEFARLAESYNVIPVYTDIATDTETPVSLYYKLIGEDIGFMLESAETGKNFGRYSFIGGDPFAVIAAYGHGVGITLDEETHFMPGKPLEVIRSFLKRFTAAPLIPLPLVAGGAVGYFAYDIISTFERVRGHSIPEDLLVSQLLFCRELVVMDHLTHTSKIVSLVRIQPGDTVESVYHEAKARLEGIKEKLQRTVVLPGQKDSEMKNSVKSNFTREQYMDLVEKSKEHIRAGNIFQVVISQQLTTELQDHPFNMYRKLRRLNPSPYMFYINFGSKKLVGASPEILVKLQNRHLTNRPIAGSRPRGENAAEDEKLAKELLADPKECAEHTMLVDLGRNDLGRVCVPGTVQVERFMAVEMFSHIMHIVSDVGGTLKPELDAVDALKACFPAGTLSGAPKVRAMEIIHELEKKSRGVYGGAIGYIDFTGNMDTCIAIRTMDIEGSLIKVQTGAGLVYDSDPGREYDETLHKAQALLKVIGTAGGEQND
ncbi:Anthranilate synthase component 1 [Propionispora sp. 2/2-37]|uniref:anthranilate synthase component I n=1 Tax=Propionispora sp. 2/2-37 TaxID=1677858 RepID=UPI0006BB67FF|nr:anthranilate synthase component I [Propionispora sp. 2/2-37]CUH96985.1 Anthranilate synthase component 1 [Propionispora sp. 2/2-37]